MGRAGAGGGGVSHHVSSGGHSSSRASGGHRVGGSGSMGGGSRARGSYGSGGSYRGGYHGGAGMPPPPPYYRRRRRYVGGPIYTTGGMGTSALGCGGLIAGILICIVALALVSVIFASLSGSGFSGTASTIQREKLESGNGYDTNCIVDEIGWFDNVSKTESRLKEFWEDTGVQPYIVLKAYDAALSTDSQKEAWAGDYYEAHFTREDVFLFVYFAEYDTDNDVGYMAYVAGKQATSVMDAEAVEIFWNYIDKYWYSDASTDDLFVKAFGETGDTIMRVSTSGWDVLKWLMVAVVVLIIVYTIIHVIRLKNERAKEKAAEDERILNTPMSELRDDSLEKKYLNEDEKS